MEEKGGGNQKGLQKVEVSAKEKSVSSALTCSTSVQEGTTSSGLSSIPTTEQTTSSSTGAKEKIKLKDLDKSLEAKTEQSVKTFAETLKIGLPCDVSGSSSSSQTPSDETVTMEKAISSPCPPRTEPSVAPELQVSIPTGRDVKDIGSLSSSTEGSFPSLSSPSPTVSDEIKPESESSNLETRRVVTSMLPPTDPSSVDPRVKQMIHLLSGAMETMEPRSKVPNGTPHPLPEGICVEVPTGTGPAPNQTLAEWVREESSPPVPYRPPAPGAIAAAAWEPQDVDEQNFPTFNCEYCGFHCHNIDVFNIHKMDEHGTL